MKNLVLAALVISIVALNGCQTSKNAALGVYGVGKGVAQDSYGVFQGLVVVDRWIEDRLW